MRIFKEYKDIYRWAFHELEGFEDYILDTNKNIGIKVLDEYTLVFKFKHPSNLFVKKITGLNFSISKIVNNKYFGTGPYVIESINSKSSKLIQNNYYPFSNDNNSPKRIEFIIEKVNKHIDLSLGMPSPKIAQNLSEVKYNYFQAIIMYLNLNSNKFKHSKKRCSFLKNFNQIAKTSGYPWENLNNKLPFGWGMFDGFENENLEKNYITQKVNIIAANSAAVFNQKINDNIYKLSDKKYKIDIIPINNLIERLKNGSFEAAIFGYFPDYLSPDAYLSPFLMTDQQYNFTKYSNKVIDELLGISGRISNIDTQKIIFERIFSLLAKDCPLWMLGSEKGIYYLKKEWKPLTPSGLGVFSLKLSDLKRRYNEK